MKPRVFVLGLDCLDVSILEGRRLEKLPHLKKMVDSGMSGKLISTVPPITIPAWTAMMSGRDPGELGIYGFRNRRSYDYFDTIFASSSMVKYKRIWDYVGEKAGKSIVVGVPQTSPPSGLNGIMVSGFEGVRSSGGSFTFPDELKAEIQESVGDYIFDVEDFRNTNKDQVLEKIYEMTTKRFDLMERFIKKYDWDFAMLCEIGTDRIHHVFWRYYDDKHPFYEPDSEYHRVIEEYYEFIDRRMGRLLALLDDETAVFVVSDHGAKAMQGGFCINEWLIMQGWLKLKETPSGPVKLTKQMIDWSGTTAWGEGGYYARIFLNIEGREPEGIVPFREKDEIRRQISSQLKTVELMGGLSLENEIHWPENIYRTVRGLSPDLIVLFGDLNWRSIGTVGYNSLTVESNDTGADDANHSMEGMFAASGPGIPQAEGVTASIFDITPTILEYLRIDSNQRFVGKDLFKASGGHF